MEIEVKKKGEKVRRKNKKFLPGGNGYYKTSAK